MHCKLAQISNEKIRADVNVLLVCRRLVDFDRLAEKLDHIHNFDRIICILFAEKFDKAEALMRAGNAILWHIDARDRPCLHEQFPKNRF